MKVKYKIIIFMLVSIALLSLGVWVDTKRVANYQSQPIEETRQDNQIDYSGLHRLTEERLNWLAGEEERQAKREAERDAKIQAIAAKKLLEELGAPIVEKNEKAVEHRPLSSWEATMRMYEKAKAEREQKELEREALIRAMAAKKLIELMDENK